MPNWVYNDINISGTDEDLKKFLEKATAVHPEGVSGETGEWQMTKEPEFSFWNFIAPPKEAIESGEYFGTHGYSDGKSVGHTPNNWYEWNNREWNTKWDACDTYTGEVENGSLGISFNTAWSIPEPVFLAMVEQHPELSFAFRSVEEQGWGAEYEGEDGVLGLTAEWDIPNSHQEYLNLGDPDGCRCAWEEDPEDWYDDCPRSEEEEQVVAHDADGSVSARKLRAKFDAEFKGLVQPE